MSYLEVRGEGLPVIVWKPRSDPDFVKGVVNLLASSYKKYFYERPSLELVMSWEMSIPEIFSVFDEYPVILEYQVLGGPERTDFIVVGHNKALIIESKVWRGKARRRNFFVQIDDNLRIDPCYQLNNYLAKFKNLHSASSKLSFNGTLFIQGFEYSDTCKVASKVQELEEFLDWLNKPGDMDDVNAIVKGRFQITKGLVDFINENYEKLLQDAVKTLLGGGYGLTEEQLRIVERVLETIENNEDKAFFIKGVSGSGKTLVSLTLLFECLKRGHKVLMAYKNNRLLNTLRKVLGHKLEGLIRFYAMGPQGRFRGIAERNFPINEYGNLDLVIYDEAQRMSKENIGISLGRSKVKVYLYDDEQLLVGEEAGTRQHFTKIARELNFNYDEYELSVPRRIPPSYLKALRDLLDNRPFDPSGIDFRIFDDVKEMLRCLREKHENGHRVALVCAFTETPGNRRNIYAPDNLRIGHPLPSNLDIYKGLNIKVYWLMDEKAEYPVYWMGRMDPLSRCASVYGAQGFEAEYVGVVWGRDLIWRGEWIVNPDAITDYIGNRYSLRSLAKVDPKKALKLLKNRYLILLTRGTKGAYVFFEDRETKEHVEGLMRG